jgi:hypothetical protein
MSPPIITSLEEDMERRGYALGSSKEPASTPDAFGFSDEDLLDLAEDYGTVVDTDPDAGILGFVTFGEGEFIDFCRKLVRQGQNVDSAGPTVMIQNHMDYVMAVGAFNPLAKMLRQTYKGQEWPKTDKYVQAFDQLFSAILDFERRNPHFSGPAAQMAGLIRLSDKSYDELRG